MRLVVQHAGNERDVMTLHAESPTQDAGLAELRGEVKLVAPGSLPNDGKVIADERTYA